MRTFKLSDLTQATTVQDLVGHAAGGGVAVHDQKGKTIAYVILPHDREAMAYLDAFREYELHRKEIAAALEGTGGVTTVELLKKAEQARLELAEESRLQVEAASAESSFNYHKWALGERVPAAE